MAQLILKGLTQASSEAAIAQAGGTTTLTYFDSGATAFDDALGNPIPFTNANMGVLEVGDMIYTTYTPADQTDPDPNNWTTESYSNPYSTGSQDSWMFAQENLASYNSTNGDFTPLQPGRQLAIMLQPTLDPNGVSYIANGNNVRVGQIGDIVEVSYDSFTSDVTSVDEGSPVVFTVNTTNIPDNTTVGWTITGVDSSDITGGSLTGTILITGNTGTATITPAADAFTDGGVETMTVTLDATDSNGVNTEAPAIDVDINDVSLTPNQPPQQNPATYNVTQNGNGNDYVSIDLSQISSDPEGDPMTWKVWSLPASGSLRDEATPTQNISSVPYTIQGSGYEIRYYPDNTGAPSTTTFTYKAEDGISTQTAFATITINIQAPANQPPTVDGIAEVLVADGTTNSVTFTRTGQDDSGITPTFSWTDQNGTPISGLPSLTYGSLQQLGSGETFQYTQNTGLNINPGGSPQEDNVYYIGTENVGVPSQVAQVQIQNVAPGNNAPVWNQTPGAPIAINAGTVHTITGLEATDADGHTLT